MSKRKVLSESQAIQKLNFFLEDGMSLSEAEYLDKLISELDEQIEQLDEEIEALDEENLEELTPQQRQAKKDYKKANTVIHPISGAKQSKNPDPLTYGRPQYSKGGDKKRTSRHQTTKAGMASKHDTNQTKDMIKHTKGQGSNKFMRKTGTHKPANLPADRGMQAQKKEREKQALAKKREQLSKQREKLG